MKKILFISFLFLSGIFTANAQWQKVLQAGIQGPILPYRGNLLCTTGNGLYLSLDTGKTWKVSDTNTALQYVNLFATKDSLLFGAELGYAGIYVSVDSGKSWKSVTPLPAGIQISSFICSGNNLLAGTVSNGMYLSTDYGKTWDTLNNGLPRPTAYNQGAIGSFINMGNNTIVIYGTQSYITYNHGFNWYYKGNKCTEQRAIILLGNDIYQAENSSIIRSGDSTLSWTIIYTSLFGMDGICTDSHYIMVSDESIGIFFSNDSGNHWAEINTGLPNNQIEGVAILGSYIFCCTYSQVFRMPLAEAAAVPETLTYTNGINPLPSGLPSLDIYPDPIKHSATVDFGQTLQNGSLQIFNAQGQRVQQIDQIIGQKIILQPNNLPAGTYTYLLTEQGKATAAGKFIIQ